MKWNSHSPQSWSQRLGMLSVPLFGSTRTAVPPGTHVLLLDGHRASFTFSAVQAASQLAVEDLLSWAWSCNVTYSLVSEESTGQLRVHRWDDPHRVLEYHRPSRRAAEAIVEALRNSARADATTVVSHAVALFRGLRRNLEERQATPEFIVRAFNALVLWATFPQSAEATSLTVGEIFDRLNDQGWDFEAADANKSILAFPAEDFFHAALARVPGRPYALDTDLMLRHAAGAIYQEAHRELARASIYHQPRLFDDDFVVSEDSQPRLSPKDIHYTQPELARALVLEAARAFPGQKSTIDVLDPACGSGVFLIEAAREFSAKGAKTLRLYGIDSSLAACEMARFNLRYQLKDISPRSQVHITSHISCANSLEVNDWGADLILMNPPFVSWGAMPASDQTHVRAILGDLAHGRSDLSAAFLYKAVASVRRDGVVASILPVSLLNNKAGNALRLSIASDPDVSIRLLGRFSGYDYFANATVEPAFAVIARRADKSRPRIVLASKRYVDRAIRKLRRTQSLDVVEPFGEAIVDINTGNWAPCITHIADLLQRLHESPRIGALFDVKLGVRTGDNAAFVITRTELMALPKREQKYFRPAAGTDTIRQCVLWPSQYVFYPYDEYGNPTIDTIEALKENAPRYLEMKLSPRKPQLSRRYGVGKEWWLLSRPRSTWQGTAGPRIVSASFAEIGKFALDTEGEYVVVQGNAWLWRSPAIDNEMIWLAYLAIANSPNFMLLFSHYCRQVQGGQYEAYAKYSKHVPIPDLSTKPRTAIKRLAEMGRGMFDGWFPDITDLDDAVAKAYGATPEQFVKARPELDAAGVAESFKRLASQCRRETAVLSNPRQIAAHPAYQQIVRLGKPAIAHIIGAMENDGGLWFQAIASIAGEKPKGVQRSTDIGSAIEQWTALSRERGWL